MPGLGPLGWGYNVSWGQLLLALGLEALEKGCSVILSLHPLWSGLEPLKKCCNASCGWRPLLSGLGLFGKGCHARWGQPPCVEGLDHLGKAAARVNRLGMTRFQGNLEAGQTLLTRLIESDRFGTCLHWSQPGGRRPQQKKQWHLPVLQSPERVPSDPCPSGTCSEVSRFNFFSCDPGNSRTAASGWSLEWVS